MEKKRYRRAVPLGKLCPPVGRLTPLRFVVARVQSNAGRLADCHCAF